jgi:hypothetical protein
MSIQSTIKDIPEAEHEDDASHDSAVDSELEDDKPENGQTENVVAVSRLTVVFLNCSNCGSSYEFNLKQDLMLWHSFLGFICVWLISRRFKITRLLLSEVGNQFFVRVNGLQNDRLI